MRRLPLSLILLLLSAPALAKPGLEIASRIEQSADPLPFGKPATLILDLSWDEKWGFVPPPADSLELEGFTVLDRFSTNPTAPQGRSSISYHLVFTRFEPGSAQLPALSFQTPSGSLKSQPQEIVYKGAEAKEGDQPDQLRGPKEVIELSTAGFWWSLAKGLTLTLLLALLVGFLAQKLGLVDRWRSPRARSLRQLARIKKALKTQKLDGPAALLEAVEVLRVYLHAAHGLVTREATTKEISEQLILSNRCPELRPTARTILEYGDRTKFARRQPNLEESLDLINGLQAALLADKRGAK